MTKLFLSLMVHLKEFGLDNYKFLAKFELDI
jgi:hypothetical protein